VRETQRNAEHSEPYNMKHKKMNSEASFGRVRMSRGNSLRLVGAGLGRMNVLAIA